MSDFQVFHWNNIGKFNQVYFFKNYGDPPFLFHILEPVYILQHTAKYQAILNVGSYS